MQSSTQAQIIPNISASILTVTTEEQRQKWRQQCRSSLYFLCKAVLGFKDFNTSVHLPASLFVQNQDAKRKLFMLPRSFFKSYLATIGYPIWLLIQEYDPANGFYGSEERILIANATFENAAHFLGKIKSVFEKNTTFQWLFPELIPNFTDNSLVWNQTEAVIARKNDYPEPTLTAAGVGAAVVSRHFTRIILDDLINEKHTVSPDLMRKAIDWYSYTEPLLVESQKNEILVIGTRWAFNDLYSHIEETEGEYDPINNPRGYAKHIRKAIENDKPIFPERFDRKELARLRVKLHDYMYSCLYLNDPRQPGVNDFDVDWLCYYSFDDKGMINREDGKIVDPKDLDRFAIVDIASSIRKDADYSACVVFGISEWRDIYVLDVWHGRVTTKLLVEQFLKLARRWHVRCLYYEDSATQKLIEHSLHERIRETGQYVRIDSVKPGNQKSKEDRIRAISRFFQAGRVHIRESFTHFKQEYMDFPLGKHDDILDCFGYLPQAARFEYPEEEERERATKSYQDNIHWHSNIERDDLATLEQHFNELEVRLQGRSIVTGY